MKAVVLAAGEGTRLRHLTKNKPKAMVEVGNQPLVAHCFDRLVGLGADELVVVVGYQKERIIEHFDDQYRDVPITYAHQREPKGLAHALLTVENQISEPFMLMLGDNVFSANLSDVVDGQLSDNVDAAFLVEEVAWDEASRYGVCVTNSDGQITEVVEKPDNPPSRLVMTGFYTFSPAIFHACHLVQPSDRGEYELSDAIQLLIQSGRSIEAVQMEGWRVDVGYPEDRERAESKLEEITNPGERK